MPNLNETMCNCEGFSQTDGSCEPYDADIHSSPPCPDGFWGTVGGWDWEAISSTSLQWMYAFGVLKPPSANLETQAYMMELQRQQKQTNMIMLGLGFLMLIVLIIVLRKGGKKGKK